MFRGPAIEYTTHSLNIETQVEGEDANTMKPSHLRVGEGSPQTVYDTLQSVGAAFDSWTDGGTYLLATTLSSSSS
jgi:hypothetical protein